MRCVLEGKGEMERERDGERERGSANIVRPKFQQSRRNSRLLGPFDFGASLYRQRHVQPVVRGGLRCGWRVRRGRGRLFTHFAHVKFAMGLRTMQGTDDPSQGCAIAPK
jgi:hypothetical protein